MQSLVSCNLWCFVWVYTVFTNTAAAVAILVLIARKECASKCCLRVFDLLSRKELHCPMQYYKWSSFDLICRCGLLLLFSACTFKSLYLLGFHNSLMIGSSDRDWWFLLLSKIDAYSGRAELWVNQCDDNMQFTKKQFLLYFLNTAFDRNTLCSKCCTGEFQSRI